jgi:uncharacterized glyoxalase superfamily protein PhnB
MQDPWKRNTFVSSVYYADPDRALDWLTEAFGFERVMVLRDDAGTLVHSEMMFGDGQIMIGSPWADFVGTPAGVGGKNTQFLHVKIDGDLEAHCARAKAAGAKVLREPEDQFYGDRTYLAQDFEGHVWSFAKPVKAVTREEAEAATGLKIEGWVG